MRKQGYVFVSVEGHYAVTRTSCDHGPTRQVVRWVECMDDAEVFVSENVARRNFKELEKAQALQAVETRVIQFHAWVKPELIPAEPVSPPPAPEEYRPFPPAAIQRPAWQCIDCDRRVFIDGALRYFDDTEALPLGVAHSEVEYQHGIEAYHRKFHAFKAEQDAKGK